MDDLKQKEQKQKEEAKNQISPEDENAILRLIGKDLEEDLLVEYKEKTAPHPQTKESKYNDSFWDQYLKAWQSLANETTKLLRDFKEFPKTSGGALRSAWIRLSPLDYRLRNDPKMVTESADVKEAYWKTLQLHIDVYKKNYAEIWKSIESLSHEYAETLDRISSHAKGYIEDDVAILQSYLESLLALANDLPKSRGLSDSAQLDMNVLNVLDSINQTLKKVQEFEHRLQSNAVSRSQPREVKKPLKDAWETVLEYWESLAQKADAFCTNPTSSAQDLETLKALFQTSFALDAQLLITHSIGHEDKWKAYIPRREAFFRSFLQNYNRNEVMRNYLSGLDLPSSNPKEAESKQPVRGTLTEVKLPTETADSKLDDQDEGTPFWEANIQNWQNLVDLSADFLTEIHKFPNHNIKVDLKEHLQNCFNFLNSLMVSPLWLKADPILGKKYKRQQDVLLGEFNKHIREILTVLLEKNNLLFAKIPSMKQWEDTVELAQQFNLLQDCALKVPNGERIIQSITFSLSMVSQKAESLLDESPESKHGSSMAPQEREPAKVKTKEKLESKSEDNPASEGETDSLTDRPIPIVSSNLPKQETPSSSEIAAQALDQFPENKQESPAASQGLELDINTEEKQGGKREDNPAKEAEEPDLLDIAAKLALLQPTPTRPEDTLSSAADGFKRKPPSRFLNRRKQNPDSREVFAGLRVHNVFNTTSTPVTIEPSPSSSSLTTSSSSPSNPLPTPGGVRET